MQKSACILAGAMDKTHFTLRMQQSIVLTAAQRAVIDDVKAGGSVQITGKTGTGKTTVTRAVAEEMEAAGVAVDRRRWDNLTRCLDNVHVREARILIVSDIEAVATTNNVLELLRHIRTAGGVFTQTVLECQGSELDLTHPGWLELGLRLTHAHLVDVIAPVAQAEAEVAAN